MSGESPAGASPLGGGLPRSAGMPGTSGAAGMAILLGPCDELRAEVYVRVVVDPEGAASADVRLEGTLRGPECRRAVTLPVTASVVDLGGGGPPGVPVGRVVLTEPSFWTAQVPSLYRLDVRVMAGSRELAAWTRQIGLRRLGVRGRSFWLDGHRWVPRAVGLAAEAFDAAMCRGSAAAALVVDPPEELLARADEEGVAILARLSDDATVASDPAALAARLAEWAQHPSVALAVFPRGWPPEVVESLVAATRQVRGTMLLARAVAGLEPPPKSSSGCDALVVELAADAVPDAAWRTAPAMPLVACRGPATAGDVAAGRRACDRLQADLATWHLAAGAAHVPWDWAGYAIV